MQVCIQTKLALVPVVPFVKENMKIHTFHPLSIMHTNENRLNERLITSERPWDWSGAANHNNEMSSCINLFFVCLQSTVSSGDALLEKKWNVFFINIILPENRRLLCRIFNEIFTPPLIYGPWSIQKERNTKKYLKLGNCWSYELISRRKVK